MTKPKYRGFKKFTQTMILSEFELGKKKKKNLNLGLLEAPISLIIGR